MKKVCAHVVVLAQSFGSRGIGPPGNRVASRWSLTTAARGSQLENGIVFCGIQSSVTGCRMARKGHSI